MSRALKNIILAYSLRVMLLSSLLLCVACGSDSGAAEGSTSPEVEAPEKVVPEETAEIAEVITPEVDSAAILAAKANEAAERAAKEKAAEEQAKIDKEAAEAKERRRKRREARKRAPKLKFDKKTHDYGVIMQGEKVEYQFKFTNTGKSDLVIKDATATCGCTQPSYPFIPIAPGEEGYIGVVFDTKGKLGKQKPAVTIVTNASPKTYKLYLDGFVDAQREESKTNEEEEGTPQ